LLAFASARTGKTPSALDIAELDAPLIGAFLDHLENQRGNQARTRNKWEPSTVHRRPAEPRSYRGDVSGGAVTVTPNLAATYAANSSVVGRHPS
jgi:hypothetical protein